MLQLLSWVIGARRVEEEVLQKLIYDGKLNAKGGVELSLRLCLLRATVIRHASIFPFSDVKDMIC